MQLVLAPVSQFCNVGIPTINLGPGDSKLAHQADEYIEIEHLKKAFEIYVEAIKKLDEVVD